ncbi:MAG: M20 family metallopeptidase [Bacillota bacterium]|nr:M20 family metallopeptidase [Bacillota bacterium]HHT91202.1 M20 family metallopeptidase [Bacillota bacterium]
MDWKAQISAAIDAKRALLEEIALSIGQHPELGFHEVHASRLLAGTLEKEGFQIKRGIAGLETAFSGSYGRGRPNIALLCEYDALPELGHACGHNLISAASLGAALGLAPFLDRLDGRVTVLGTPAEETGSGKVILVKDGFFQDVDAAMMFHPSARNLLMATSNALDAYEFEFSGKAAHAADSPEEGINALDGVIALFVGINALREHLPEGVRIHGIISEGGTAPNIVPDRAVARFYIRAPRRTQLDWVTAKVLKVAEGAALMTGSKVAWHAFELGTDNMMPSDSLSLAFGSNLQRLGVTDIEEFCEGRGSSDMGNVSRVVPAIHPYLSIGDGLIAHTAEFAQASQGPQGLQVAVLAAKALAHTAVDLLTDPSILEAARREHRRLLSKESGTL